MRLICFMLMAGAALAVPFRSKPPPQSDKYDPEPDWRLNYTMVEETGIRVTGLRFALDNKDWVRQEKAHAQIWSYHGGDNQRWYVFNKLGANATTSTGEQLFRLMRKDSGFCLNFYHDTIRQDMIPHKDIDLLIVPCKEATDFFWSGKHLCAFVVLGKPYYCMELKGKKTTFYDGVPLVVNSQGDHRIEWEKYDVKESSPLSDNS